MLNPIEIDPIDLSSDDDDDIPPGPIDESIILLTSDDEAESEAKEQEQIQPAKTTPIKVELESMEPTSPPTKKLKGDGKNVESVLQCSTSQSQMFTSNLPVDTAPPLNSAVSPVFAIPRNRSVFRMSTAGSPRVNQQKKSLQLLASQQGENSRNIEIGNDDSNDSSNSSAESSHDFEGNGELVNGEVDGDESTKIRYAEDSKGYECYDLCDDDDEDDNYKNLPQTDYYCEICNKHFKRPRSFRFHHRRHQFVDLFKCPTCLCGFPTLNLCYQHEVNEHGLKMKATDTVDMGPINSNPNNPHKSKAVTSTCLEPYKGPPIPSTRDAFYTEEKFARVKTVAKQIEIARNN